MFIYLIIGLAIISRLIPHIPNAGVITALAIFSAAYLPKKQAIVIPLAVRLISDLIIGFFSWPLMIAVYASHLSGVLFGLWIKGAKQSNRWLKIVFSGLGSASIFFLVTNFAFLYPEYPHTMTGIMQSYINALPFLRGTMVGDIGYVVSLFTVYELAKYLIGNRAKKNILIAEKI
ncbi:MAG: hypothetical protein NTY12_05095 [Candidatus Falkowbacteria bacterium]|nr:hypothetical protein [Candidatus Falkowbacteria bacterium]